jgi:hypothetical protein
MRQNRLRSGGRSVEYISAPQFSAPPNWPQPSTGLLDGSKWRPRSSRCYSSRREAWLPTARQDAGRPQIRGDRVSEPVSDSRSRPATLLPRSGRQPGPAALAQSAERLTRNEKVVGSIPTGGSTRTPRSSLKERGRSRGFALTGFCFFAGFGACRVGRRGQGSGVARPRSGRRALTSASFGTCCGWRR